MQKKREKTLAHRQSESVLFSRQPLILTHCFHRMSYEKIKIAYHVEFKWDFNKKKKTKQMFGCPRVVYPALLPLVFIGSDSIYVLRFVI